MINILTIIGARPQIIKAAAISRAIATKYSNKISEHILHTGQHYDEGMSDIFFRELGIPTPTINLHIGSESQGIQTARMIEGIEHVLANNSTSYDGVIVYGDTNSTLAASIAASKMHIPLFHVEAGLRSFNMSMPEEINRIVCDQLSSLLFTPTMTSLCNLEAEGFTAEGIKSRIRFANGKGQRAVLSGDVMYDNALYFSALADQKSDILERLGLEAEHYVLTTVHRPANTDIPENLQAIFKALLVIAEEKQTDVLFPLHPRTSNLLDAQLGTDLLKRITKCPKIHLIPPVSFLEMISLEKHATVVLTDSGGVQKEAFFFGKPSVIMRPETEWTEIVEVGAGIVTDANCERIVDAYEQLVHKSITTSTTFGDGHASERIIEEIIHYFE